MRRRNDSEVSGLGNWVNGGVSLTQKQNIGRGTGVGGRENEFLVCENSCLACCLVFDG